MLGLNQADKNIKSYDAYERKNIDVDYNPRLTQVMSPERGIAITERAVKTPDNVPLTALGELIYGPETVRFMIGLSTTLGRALSYALGGTLEIRSAVLGTGITGPVERSNLPTQTNLNNNQGGAI